MAKLNAEDSIRRDPVAEVPCGCGTRFI